MAGASDIRWFKDQFATQIQNAIVGTPFTVDFLTAIACQETGDVWPILVKKGLPVPQILTLCVGDTLDADKGREAFPKTKTDLLNVPNGSTMFTLAHSALVDMAKYIPSYATVALNPDKFCHAFGIFQLDLQFFNKDPSYFIQKDYAVFDMTLNKCLGELKTALVKLSFEDRGALSDVELAQVAIIYNTGRFDPQRGLEQGYYNGTKYYGQEIFDYIHLAHLS